MAQQQITIPKKGGGGPLLKDAEDKDLIYWIGRKKNDLETSSYPDRDRAFIVAAEAELKRRGVDPAQSAESPPSRGAQQGARPQQRQQSRAIQSVEQPQQMMVGTFNNASAASQALVNAAERYHLVSPATIVGRLPEGCEVVISVVQIDAYRDVYNITGSADDPKDGDTVGLDRVALARIAAAAGVTWVSSHRTDDGSHPHYCAWEAIARFKNFDMSESDVPGNVDIDTREDGDIRGPAAEEIRTKQAHKPDKGDKQLLELRKFLLRQCESKAMNKAIGNKGVRRSYKRHELKDKPFAVAQLMFTGHSDDPEARRDFRQMIGQRFLGARSQMYATAAPTPVAPPAMLLPQQAYVQQQFVPHSPPPIGTRLDQGYGAEEYDDSYFDGAPEPTPTPRPAQPSQTSQPAKPEGAPDPASL